MNISNLLPRTMGIVALLLALLPLRAQETTFFVEDLMATAGDDISVNVRAVNIADLVGVQLSIDWDESMLEFTGVSNVVFNGSLADNFNQTQLDSGRIGFLLVDASLEGFDLPDSTILFTLDFSPLTANPLTTEIEFGDIPLRFSAQNNLNVRLDCNQMPGVVICESPTSIPSFGEDPRFQVAPNPFREFVRITTRLDYGGRASLELLDLKGRLIHQRTVNLTPGEQTNQLSAADFPATGAYIIRLVTDHERLHRKVVLTSSIR
jgi:hypothetical protein